MFDDVTKAFGAHGECCPMPFDTSVSQFCHSVKSSKSFSLALTIFEIGKCELSKNVLFRYFEIGCVVREPSKK